MSRIDDGRDRGTEGARRRSRPAFRWLAGVAAVAVWGCAGFHKPEDRAARAIEELRQPDETRRTLAERRLGRLGRPAVPALREILREGEDDIRYSAVRAIARMGEEGAEAIPELLAMLADPTCTIQASAAEAVAAVGAPVVGALADAAEDGSPELMYWIAYALGRSTADPAATVPVLAALLSSASPVVKAQATASLVQIGSPAVPSIIEARDEATPGVESDLEAVLRAIGTRAALAALESAEGEKAGGE